MITSYENVLDHAEKLSVYTTTQLSIDTAVQFHITYIQVLTKLVFMTNTVELQLSFLCNFHISVPK